MFIKNKVVSFFHFLNRLFCCQKVLAKQKAKKHFIYLTLSNYIQPIIEQIHTTLSTRYKRNMCSLLSPYNSLLKTRNSSKAAILTLLYCYFKHLLHDPKQQYLYAYKIILCKTISVQLGCNIIHTYTQYTETILLAYDIYIS